MPSMGSDSSTTLHVAGDPAAVSAIEHRSQHRHTARIFLTPRSWRLTRRQPVSDEDRPPYPRWLTVLTRTAFAALEIGVAVYIGIYHQQTQAGSPSMPGTDAALGGVGLAAAIDGIIALLALTGWYDAGKACGSAVLDIIPGVVCLYGAISIVWPEVPPNDPTNYARELSSNLAVVVGTIHFAACIGGCIGCCLVCSRTRKAKKNVGSSHFSALGATEPRRPLPLPVWTQNQEGVSEGCLSRDTATTLDGQLDSEAKADDEMGSLNKVSRKV